jgi:cation:H+ antiporter
VAPIQRTRLLPDSAIVEVIMAAVGSGLLALGGSWLVESAAAIATALGVGEAIIGLTIVSIGTSLPEAVTSLIALARGERDIAVGNVIGSNICNILLILGITSVSTGTGIDVSAAMISFDIPVMIAAAVACLPIFLSNYCINRWEGVFFLAYYIAYVSYLYLRATEHDTLHMFSWIMVLFVLPLGFVTLLAIILQEIRKRRARPV